jgi:hypothetical protein
MYRNRSNEVLSASVQAPKSFIADVNTSSAAIQDLMVLGQEPSILGYPNEISRALNADHGDMCKYSSPHDPNYLRVRHVIRSLVVQARDKAEQQVRYDPGNSLDRKLLGPTSSKAKDNLSRDRASNDHS